MRPVPMDCDKKPDLFRKLCFPLRYATLVFCLLCLLVPLADARLLTADAIRAPEPLMPYCTWLEDPDGTLTIEDVASGNTVERFTELDEGISVKSVGPVWIRLIIIKTPQSPGLYSRAPARPRLLMNLGDLPPGRTQVFFSEPVGPVESKGVWHSMYVVSREDVLLPEPGVSPLSVYIRMDSMPGLWFSPTVSPENATAPDFLPSELLLPGLIIVSCLGCLLRAMSSRTQWALWGSVYLLCILAQALLPVPAAGARIGLRDLPALLAPGMAVILLPHIARCMFRTDQESRAQDYFLYFCSLLGVAACILPLIPQLAWLTRLFPLWALLLVPLLPMGIGMLASHKPGALAFLGANCMPLVGTAVTLYAFNTPDIHPLAVQGGLWGAAVGGLGLFLARVPTLPAANLRKKHPAQENKAAGFNLDSFIPPEATLRDPANPEQEGTPISRPASIPDKPELHSFTPFEYDSGQGTSPLSSMTETRNTTHTRGAEPYSPAIPAFAGASDSYDRPLTGQPRVISLLEDDLTVYTVGQQDNKRSYPSHISEDNYEFPDDVALDVLDELRSQQRRDSTLSEGGYLFNLHSLVREVHDIVAPLAKNKGLIFSWFIAPTLPSLLEGDAPRLRGALSLLLQNAVQATRRGAVQLAVRKTPGATQPGDLLFAISDNGAAQRTDAGFFHAWELAARTGGVLTVDYSPTSGTHISFTARFSLPSQEASARHMELYPPQDEREADITLFDDPSDDAFIPVLHTKTPRLSPEGSGQTEQPTGQAGDHNFVEDAAHEQSSPAASAYEHNGETMHSQASVDNEHRHSLPDLFTPPAEELVVAVEGTATDAASADEHTAEAAHEADEFDQAEQITVPRDSETGFEAHAPEAVPNLPETEAHTGDIETPSEVFVPEGTQLTEPEEQAFEAEPGGIWPPRILAAEMTTSNRRLLAGYLADFPYEHSDATSNSLVPDMRVESPVSLIIFDADTPEPDIIKSIEAIREQEESLDLPNAPVLVLTSHEAQSERMRASGSAFALCKPYSREALRDTVIQAIPSLARYAPADSAPTASGAREGVPQISTIPTEDQTAAMHSDPFVSGLLSSAPQSEEEQTPISPDYSGFAPDNLNPVSDANGYSQDGVRDQSSSESLTDVVNPVTDDIPAPPPADEADEPVAYDAFPDSPEQPSAFEPYTAGNETPPTDDTNSLTHESDESTQPQQGYIWEAPESQPSEARPAETQAQSSPEEYDYHEPLQYQTDSDSMSVGHSVTTYTAPEYELARMETGNEASELVATSYAEDQPATGGLSTDGDDTLASHAPNGTPIARSSAEYLSVNSWHSPLDDYEAPSMSMLLYEPDLEMGLGAYEEETLLTSVTREAQAAPMIHDLSAEDVTPQDEAPAPGEQPSSVFAPEPQETAEPPALPKVTVTVLPKKRRTPVRVAVQPIKNHENGQAQPDTAKESREQESKAEPQAPIATGTTEKLSPEPIQEAVADTGNPTGDDPTVAVGCQDPETLSVQGDFSQESTTENQGEKTRDVIDSDPNIQVFVLDGIEGESLDSTVMPLVPGLTLFLRDAMRDVSRATTEGSCVMAQESAGRLAARAEHFGLQRLGKIARCVERAAQAGDLEAVRTLLEDLTTVTSRYVEALDDSYLSFINLDR